MSFLIFCLDFDRGFKLFNYADKPDLTTNELIKIARDTFERNGDSHLRIPYSVGLLAGLTFDLLANISGKSFSISSIRIKKFCADTAVATNRLSETGFEPPCTLKQALEKTIKKEFTI